MEARAQVTETTEHRAVVTWAGPDQPIVLTLYGPAGEVAVPLLPKRALELAQELLTRGVQAIKADQWDTPPSAGEAVFLVSAYPNAVME